MNQKNYIVPEEHANECRRRGHDQLARQQPVLKCLNGQWFSDEILAIIFMVPSSFISQKNFFSLLNPFRVTKG